MAEALRPLVDFPPSPWSAEYLASLSPSDSEIKTYTERVDELKLQVKNMLNGSANDAVEKVKLIDLLRRLGISYHFENEIANQLATIFNSKSIDADELEYDLYTVALLFRVFRQHGHKMSCEVFNKFKDEDGEFKKALSSDVQGMLSLYEAAHLSVQGDDILDEALDYTIANLKFMVNQCSSHLAKHIAYALHQPFHKGIWRLESMGYIFFYEEEELHNEVLIKFAKLDFTRVQLLHQRELAELARWYKDKRIDSEFSYARQRIAECYLWAMGTSFEPQYVEIRINTAKVILSLSILDDTFDAFGTIEELQQFTDAIQKWNITATHRLPDYMKSLYKMIMGVYDELESNLKNKERSYWVSYAKDTVKQLVKAYHLEAEWCNNNYVPSFEEYIENASISSGYHAVSVLSFVGMEEIAGMETFEWFKNSPKIDRATRRMCRLMDDIVSTKDEKKRSQHVSTSVECYMKQYKISSEKEAIEHLKREIKDAWKDINEECMGPTALSMPLLVPFLNLARVMDVFYKHKDGYTNCESLKHYINSLFIEGIPIQDYIDQY
ncbi:probable terpene synthase 6 [Tripterygium wilfordii]|uniref:probable terpene synthase 6 n=1 Tax=Tripterygium wilfordii TaxID=458696 RepID=UPI0018F85556|nr:probable terpene synthase 6 [Tripterygium wilfordii]